MASLEQHVAAIFGDQALTIAKQAVEIDALREALAAERANPKSEPQPEEAQS